MPIDWRDTDEPPAAPPAAQHRNRRRAATPSQRTGRGREAERIAARYLEGRGWEVVERNVRIGGSEIDVIARTGALLVFVEVRSRWRGCGGGPERTIGADKKARILSAAAAWLAARGLSDERVRLDVVALDASPGGWRLRHVEGAIVSC